MVRLLKYRLRNLLAPKVAPKGDERTGFDFVWAILMLTGCGLVLSVALRMVLS